MARDTSGHLQALVAQFAASTDAAARKAVAVDLIYGWAGVTDIDPDSRASSMIYGNAIGDARKLASLEAFLGESYLGVWCWGTLDPNPHAPAATVLLTAFDQLTTYVTSQLQAQTQLKPLYDSIGLTINSAGEIQLDLAPTVALLQAKFAADPVAGAQWMHDYGANLKANGQTDILTQMSSLGSMSGDAFSVRLATLGFNSVQGDSANNTLGGTSADDLIFGYAGNDALFGYAGNDTLSGGMGTDSLSGGAGDDSYLFNLGDGQDTLIENFNEGSDTLLVGAGITAASTQISRGGILGRNLVLSFNATDSVSIQNYFYDDSWGDNRNGGRIESIVFAYGTSWDYAAIAAGLTNNGTAGADYLYGLAGVDNRINGLGGNDFLYGSSTADVLNGGDGSDALFGYAGSDTLSGGMGSDTLSGGAGDDIYKLGRGDGLDTIQENDATVGNTDVAQFDTGIALDQLWFRQVSNSLEVSVIGTSDAFTVSNWYLGSQYHVEQFKTSDGKTLLDSQVQNLVSAMAGFAPPPAGQTTLAADYQTALSPVLAANWQ